MANTFGTNVVGTNDVGGDIVVVAALVIEQEIILPAEQVSLTIENDITQTTSSAQIWIQQIIEGALQPTLVIQQEIEIPVLQPSVVIENDIYGVEQVSLGIEQQIVDSALVVPGVRYVWRVKAILDGVDVSARLINEVNIRHAENASGIAEFDMVPESGVFDPFVWVGKPITLDYVSVDANNNTLWEARKFTGIVAEPEHIADVGIVRFLCTTDRQGRLDAMTPEQIASLVGGQWSEHVFEENVSGHQLAEDRLSTIKSSLWINYAGSFQTTPWETKIVPDETITEANRLADTFSIERAEKTGIVNRVVSDIDFRFVRFKQRNVRYNFKLNLGLCDFFFNTFPLPTRNMIETAVSGTGWDLQGSIRYTDLWDPGVYSCNPAGTTAFGTVVWGFENPDNFGGSRDPDLPLLCQGARFTLSKRWTQTVTETYSLDVRSPTSITANGERSIEEGYGIDTESENVTWEENKTYLSRISNGGFTDSPTQTGGSFAAMPSGSTILDNGDYLFEATQQEHNGRDALADAIDVLLNKAEVTIAASHRRNRVSMVLPFHPWLDLSHTVLTDDQVAQGKIAELEDRWSITTGEATTTIHIAITQTGGLGIDAATPLTAPAIPDSDPLTVYDRSVSLRPRIGGTTTSAAFDETWDGYITNYDWDRDNPNPFSTDPNDPQTVIYPERFAISTPEIESGDRNSIVAISAGEYTVAIEEDTLVEVF